MQADVIINVHAVNGENPEYVPAETHTGLGRGGVRVPSTPQWTIFHGNIMEETMCLRLKPERHTFSRFFSPHAKSEALEV